MRQILNKDPLLDPKRYGEKDLKRGTV